MAVLAGYVRTIVIANWTSTHWSPRQLRPIAVPGGAGINAAKIYWTCGRFCDLTARNSSNADTGVEEQISGPNHDYEASDASDHRDAFNAGRPNSRATRHRP